MAFEDIKVRGLTFAERGELIKSGLDPLYTPVPEEAPGTERLLRSRDLAQWIMQHIYGLTEDEINHILSPKEMTRPGIAGANLLKQKGN